MKKPSSEFVAVIAALSVSLASSFAAVKPPPQVDQDSYDWYEGSEFGLEGQAWPDMLAPYARIPKTEAPTLPSGPRWKGEWAVGLHVRFVTDSDVVLVRSVARDPFTKKQGKVRNDGLDTYRRVRRGEWRYHERRQWFEGVTNCTYALWSPGEAGIVYLPQHGAVESFRIGVKKGSSMRRFPHESGVRKPVVHYGTSIVGGGAATRAGLMFTAVASRLADVPYANLGFSGNGWMEIEVARMLARADASLYIVDCGWNMRIFDHATAKSRTTAFIRLLHEKHPETPILLCEAAHNGEEPLWEPCEIKMTLEECNRPYAEAYEELKADIPNLHYLSRKGLLPDDGEAQNDFIHPNDYGMMHMGRVFADKIKAIVKIPCAPACGGCACDSGLKLAGDGVADDTAAIQALIDTGRSCVALPPPKDHYVISKTLLLGSGQELRLDRFTRIRLAKGSNCFMLANRDREAGNRRIALTGGIWDFDNVNQAPNPQQAHRCSPPVKVSLPKSYDPDFFMGILMSFRNVDDLQIRHVTFRNPGSYSCQLAGVSNFRVDDVTFDFDRWNPIRLNMDGIHLDGDCRHGRITDLFGTCFDDLVAINANDGFCSPKEAPITDIEVDGIHAEYCHSAVRILSAGAPIRRISVRNVFGNFYTYAVGLTHFFPQKPRGTFEDIVIENVFAAKALSPEDIGVRSRVNFPLVWLQGPVDAGSVTVRNFARTEKTVPVATIRIDKEATVRRLTVRDCRMANELAEPIPFIENLGKVETLACENNGFAGEWKDTCGKGR